MLSLTLLGVFVASLGIIWWFQQRLNDESRKYKPIPGPYGIPLFGNLFQLGTKMHIKFSKWAEKYGKIYQIKMGARTAIVVSDPKWVKEMFSNEPAFAGRQFFEGFEMYENEPLGIVSIEGEFWEAHRRFLLRQLRDFGFGKSSMEQLLMDEVGMTIQRFRTFKGKTVTNVKQIFQVAVINALWMIVSGQRFDQDDPKIVEMMDRTHELTTRLLKRFILLFVPWTRYFLPPLDDKLIELKNEGRKFYEDAVAEHKATYQEGVCRDFIDVYLAEMKQNENNPESPFYGSKAERQLNAILADLFFAGADTTSMTLSWAVLYLCKYPEIQRKLQEEITEVTGDMRDVTLEDREKMPYTQALIEETLRYSSVVGAGVQHRAIVGKEFKGYWIPQNCWIFANLQYFHHGSEFWHEPESFRPERFLSEDGKVFKKNENMMPFQVGRRECIGQPIARNSIFLYTTNVFQKFNIRFSPDHPEPSMEPEVGFVIEPKNYFIVVDERTKTN